MNCTQAYVREPAAVKDKVDNEDPFNGVNIL